MKQCSKCHEWKAFECFTSKYGKHQAACRQCKNAARKAKNVNRKAACIKSPWFNQKFNTTRAVDNLFAEDT